MTELIDYPAIAPEDTQRQIDAFLRQCQHVGACQDAAQKRASLKVATRHAAMLRARRDELEVLLRDGDRWLDAHPEDIEESEPAWFAAEAEYRAIHDALDTGLVAAFGEAPAHEQTQLLGVG